jgi:DnaJ family protein A protein 2
MTKKIKISIKKTCFSCIDTCTGCRGSGQMNETLQNGMFIQIRTVVCRVCSGEKVMKKFCPDCSNCQGKTFKAEEVLLQAEIPPGVSNDYTITFKGLGEQKRVQDDIEGDFIVAVQVENDPLFLRRGNDLVHTVQIDFIESIMGKKIIVPWYGDEKMEVDISDFAVIKPCPEEYIIFGRGMPKRGSDGFGDLFLTFDIKYPKKNELESELKKLKF